MRGELQEATAQLFFQTQDGLTKGWDELGAQAQALAVADGLWDLRAEAKVW